MYMGNIYKYIYAGVINYEIGSNFAFSLNVRFGSRTQLTVIRNC
jgi:hypothetical protein